MFQFLIEEVRFVVEGRSKKQQAAGQKAMADKVRSAEHQRSMANTSGVETHKNLRRDQVRSDRIRRRVDAAEKASRQHPNEKGQPQVNVIRDRETVGSTSKKHDYQHQGRVSPFRSRQDMRAFKTGKDGKLKVSPDVGEKYK